METRGPIWDVHHHWINEFGYIDRLLAAMDRLGIERMGMIAMGDLVPDLFVLHQQTEHSVDNRDLARLVKQYPDRFWGYGYMRLGVDPPALVEQFLDMGLTALKFHVPLKPYSDPDFFEVYSLARKHRMTCLFHTGIFYPPKPMPGMGIRSENYRPIHLEPIAHEFPDLSMIMAHLGVCWNDEAAALARICPNLYADISGNVGGWRSGKPPDWFRWAFYWPGSHRKILFGSDVHADRLEATLEEQRRIFEGVWPPEECAEVWAGNARRLFPYD